MPASSREAPNWAGEAGGFGGRGCVGGGFGSLLAPLGPCRDLFLWSVGCSLGLPGGSGGLLYTLVRATVLNESYQSSIRELFWAKYQDDPYYTSPTQSMMYYTRSCKTTVRHRATATPGDSLVVDRNDTSEHMQTHNAVAQKTILMI